MVKQTVVLLGDSILDNSPYTEPEPDTTSRLRQLLTPAWEINLLARDGATMSDVPSQLTQLKNRPTVAVLSIGGNDATQHIGLLDRRVSTAAEVLDELATIADDFAQRYENVARLVANAVDRTLLCTIYDVRLEPPHHARIARTPIALLNDRIITTGARLGLDILELRSVCTEADDFVLQIEPSPKGAAKIADGIAAVLLGNERLQKASVFSA